MRRLVTLTLAGLVLFSSVPARAVVCDEGTPPDPTFKEGLRPGVTHIPGFPVHELTYLRTDATIPGGLGTIVLSGHADNLDEVENYYLGVLRKRGWMLEEKQPKYGFDFRKNDRRLTLRSLKDECRGFRLTFTFARYEE